MHEVAKVIHIRHKIGFDDCNDSVPFEEKMLYSMQHNLYCRFEHAVHFPQDCLLSPRPRR